MQSPSSCCDLAVFFCVFRMIQVFSSIAVSAFHRCACQLLNRCILQEEASGQALRVRKGRSCELYPLGHQSDMISLGAVIWRAGLFQW
jgi:hypothetical protein